MIERMRGVDPSRGIDPRSVAGGRTSWATWLGVVLAVSSCHAQAESTGGETHFLTYCDDSATGCGTELECLSSVCTLPCGDVSACRVFPDAECVLSSGAETLSSCDVRCAQDSDCERVSSGHRCELGVCRAGTTPTPAAGGATNGAAGAGTGEAADSGARCAEVEIDANQVVLIGDSFFAVDHQITACLEELARGAGALEVGERYRDQSSLLNNALGTGGIAEQYADAALEGDISLVIMNGGGADVLLAGCDAPTPECPALTDAALAAGALFEQMARDGVDNVVYVGYPDPVDAPTRETMNALRPLLEAACAASSVPCHWVDLRTAFAGRYDDYVLSDGLNPTRAGSEVAAVEIWAALERECLAQ